MPISAINCEFLTNNLLKSSARGEFKICEKETTFICLVRQF